MQSTSRLVHSSEQFSIRVIDTELGEITQEVIECVHFAAAMVYKKRQLSGHLFISIVGSQIFRTGDEEGDFGFALYTGGMQHIAIAGLPIEVADVTHEHWMLQLQVSVAHEMIHYEQDLNGTLGEDGYEEEAERIANELFS